jgi:hypothetical protein
MTHPQLDDAIKLCSCFVLNVKPSNFLLGASRMGKTLLLAPLLTAALLTPEMTSAQDATTFEQFLQQYRCPVIDRLQRIYATGDPEKFRDEYLIVDLPPRRENYVQCLFYRTDKIMCEAASGFYLNAPEEPRTMYLPPSAIAALARLGFSTDDSQGNFRIDFDLANPPDFNAIATLILRALHDAYGARAQTKLDFHAPYAEQVGSKCTPVS